MRRAFFMLFKIITTVAVLTLVAGAGTAFAATVPQAAAPAATTTSLTLGQTTVDYNDEAAVLLTVTVATAAAGVPDSTVKVSSGTSTVCTITLAPASTESSSGSCSPTASEFAPGSYPLTASYAGDADYAASVSAAEPLTVVKAATTTALTLSASPVGYAGQQSEELSVAVASPDGGTPGGTVTISSGPEAVCTVTLSTGTPGTGAGSCTLVAAEFAVGAYQLTAAYSGSADYAASASDTQTLAVTQSATTTTLTLSAGSVSYGNEETVNGVIAVTAADPPSPAGAVTLSSGSIALCKSALSVAGSSECRLPSGVEFAPGTYQLTASYAGSAGDGASVSAAQTLTVTPAATVTSIALSGPAALAYGTEQSERLTVVVAPAYGGTPDGAVTVSAGATTVCTITLSGAEGSCVLPATALPTGTSELTASYAGSDDFSGSDSLPAFLTISTIATKTSLSVSASKVTYGQEQSEQVTVAVASEYVGLPAGQVTVKAGSATVCRITLAAGHGRCVLAATEFAAGSARLTATYRGAGGFAASSSAARAVTVAKAASSSALTVSAVKVTYGKEQAERLTVTVSAKHGKVTGKVLVKAGGVTLCTISLASGKGSCELSARSLRVGTYDVVVVYPGCVNFTSSDSTRETIKVVK
jgi:large repetitive protein